MSHGAKHVRLGQGTGVGYARQSKAERIAAQAEAQAIKARVFLRLHAPVTETV